MIIVKGRELLIPENERYLGTNYDTGMENRVFRIARYSQSGTDLSDLTFKVNLIFDGDPLDRAELTKTFDDNYIYLTWTVTAAQVAVTGTVFVCVTGNDTNDTVKWSSFMAPFYTEKSLGEDIETEYKKVIARVNQESEEREAADASLESAISAEASARKAADNTLQSNIYSETSARETNDAFLQTQINQIIAPSGEAPSAAEVENARIGDDGVTYLTLGEAIRKQFANLKTNVSELSIVERFRETQGLSYYINGVTFTIDQNTSNTTITNKELLYSEHPVKVNVANNYQYLVATYSASTPNAANHIANTSWLTGEYTIPARTWFAIQLRHTQYATLNESLKYKITVRDLAYIDDIDNLQSQIDNIDPRPTLYHIIVTGQSLANGSEGSPALTKFTTRKHIGKAFRFNGGARPTDGMVNDTGVEEIDLLDKCCGYFDSLCEQDYTFTLGSGANAREVTLGETISSVLGFWFCESTGEMCLVSDHGLGGKDYNGLKKGTVAYENSLRAVKHAKALCDEKRWNYVVYAIAVVHGEADLYASTEDVYKNHLKTWQNDYDSDIKAITGQTQTVQLFASQTVASSSYEFETNQIANAVFKASLEDADIHIVGPQYAYPIEYASVHMNNIGYRALGEMFGYVIGRKFNSETYPALYPISSVLNGNTITLTFNALDGLAFDTTNVAAVSDGHYGFVILGDTNNRSITNISISGNTVVITLSGAPSSGSYITYAYKTLSDEMGNIGRIDGVRGNLRTTGGYNSMIPPYTFCPMWCVVFCVPVNWTA